MTIDAKLVKDLREKTGAGMMDCKKALVDSNGDINKAIDNLRKSGIAKAEKKGARETREGIVYSYIHAGGRLGVLLELNCETDFVAKTDGFTELAHNLAMQIAATNPIAIDRESIEKKVINREREIFTDQAKSEGKPDNIVEKMVEGRIKKFCEEVVLLEQTFVVDGKIKIKDLLKQYSSELGTAVSIDSFKMLILGQGIEVEEKDFAAEVAATANN